MTRKLEPALTFQASGLTSKDLRAWHWPEGLPGLAAANDGRPVPLTKLRVIVKLLWSALGGRGGMIDSNFVNGARPAEERFATQSGAWLLKRCLASGLAVSRYSDCCGCS